MAKNRQARAAERARKAATAAAAAPQDQHPGALDAATPTEALAQAEDDYDEGNLPGQASTPGSIAQAEQQLADEAARQQALDAFASALSKKRKAAVEARRASGIEEIWREDEEFYEGIDDANRDEHATLKPRDLGGTGGSSVTSVEAPTGSTVFLNITRAYVDFSAGRAADMLLPTDDPNWDLKETPMPDIIQAFGDTTPLPPNLAKPQMSTIGQAAQKMVADAKAKVDKAKKRISDWLEESQFSAEQRKQLKDSAKVGVGILKGPFPNKTVSRAILRDEKTGSITMEVQNKTAPVSKCISYWNFYPAANCGDDVHQGDGIWEKDLITARKLRDLMGTMDADGAPMYIESTIKQCLAEGPQRKFEDALDYNAPDAESYEIWYYQGVATAEDLRAAGVDADEGKILPVVITMVNDRVIKAALSTLDSGSFTYDVMVWQPRENHWAGIGVARQVRAPQRIINAGTRNMLDNAGLAAGPQIVMFKGKVRPVGKGTNYSIRPRKEWEVDPDSNIDDVRKAFAAIEIPMVTPELMQIIQFALKMAEDVTGMPMLLQGQQGQASETVGGMQILTNNSNTPLRAIAKLFDDRVTVPHILRYYEWLLMYGPEDDEKGEFIVAARGSSALFERDAQNQAILQMAQIVNDPKYRIDPQKWFTQYLRAQRLDPAAFQYTDAEWAKIQQQQQQTPPPVDPKVQVAQIGAQARVQVAQIGAGVDQQKINRDADRDAIYAQEQAKRTEAVAEAAQKKLDQELQLAYLQYANERNLSLDEVKAQLAQTTMKVQAQKELSAMAASIELHKHENPSPTVAPASPQVLTPPTEPAGRAPAGEAWQA